MTSPRTPENRPLIWKSDEQVKTQNVMTAEVASKWYSAWLVPSEKSPFWAQPGPIYYYELEDVAEGRIAFLDHVPNPEAVRAFCQKYGFHLDEAFWFALLKRWRLEYGPCRRAEGTP